MADPGPALSPVVVLPPSAPASATGVLRLIRIGHAGASVLVACVGAAVLLGWSFDIAWIKSLLHPNGVAMNPATAVCFILSGISLWLVGRQGGGGAAKGDLWRPIASTCAGLVVVIACLRLAAYYGGWSAGVDRSLFTPRLGDNVMAPNTALAFALAGWAMLFIDVRIGRVFLAQLGALAAGSIALLSLTGYLYAATEFYRVSGFIPMALNTALTFAVLSAGIMLARPERQPVAALTSPTAGGVLARRLLPTAFLVPLGLGWLVVHGERTAQFGAELGVALFVLGVMLVFNLLIWFTSRSLARVDTERARAQAEVRLAHDRLAARVEELQKALAEVRQLRGLLPICSYCHKIREGADYTRSVEQYLAAHTDATFSHGVCPACYEKFVRPKLEKL